MEYLPYWITIIAVLIFISIPVCNEAGRRIGGRRIKSTDASETVGSGALEGAIFALLGLLIGFTFFGAAGRFDERRKLIVEEANIIGTAYLRIDLLPSNQQELREKFKVYLDSRIATYQKLPDIHAAQAEYDRSLQLQSELWTMAVESSMQTAWPPPASLFLPAMNPMIDISATRRAAAEMHPPLVVFGMLILLVLLSSFIAGYSNAGKPRRSWIQILLFSGVLAVSLYVIIDMEYPRLGFIRVDSFDQILVDLRKSWD